MYFSDSVLNQIFCDYTDTDLKLGKFHTGIPSNRAWVLCKIASAAYKIETWCLLQSWDFRQSLDFFDSGLHTCTAVARLRWR